MMFLGSFLLARGKQSQTEREEASHERQWRAQFMLNSYSAENDKTKVTRSSLWQQLSECAKAFRESSNLAPIWSKRRSLCHSVGICQLCQQGQEERQTLVERFSNIREVRVLVSAAFSDVRFSRIPGFFIMS